MNILWIAQRDLHQDLDVSTWLEPAKLLASRNHSVTLVVISTSKKKYHLMVPNLSIIELGVINHFPFVAITFHLQVIILSLYWLFSSRPDIVITHPFTGIFLLPVKAISTLFKPATKFVLDIRTIPVRMNNLNDKIKNQLNNTSIWLAKKFFHGITVVTPRLQQLIARQFHINPQQIGIWLAGVNTELFKPHPDNQFDSKSRTAFTVMYHGALAENRGIKETIQAMNYVKDKIDDIQLFILGKGLASQRLAELVNQLKLTEFVHIHSAVKFDKVPEYIAKADVGIVPLPDLLCWQVSSPLKLFEYLAMEKPVIVSNIEAHTSVVKDCSAAIFLKSTSPEDIAEGIITAYMMREQFHRVGVEGRKMVTEKFTWDHQVSKLEKYLLNLYCNRA